MRIGSDGSTSWIRRNAFQERIDRGEKIEPKEWMPEG
jgi:hypothetical protein